MTIIACVDANGFTVPTLFILPGQLLNSTTIYQCFITGSTVTVSPKGFMNSKIFIKWLDNFSSNVIGHVKRPTVLVYDGTVSYYRTYIVKP